MKKYPIVLQDESKDCGASCISMILKFYNGYVPKSKLVEMTKTTKSGTNALNIKNTLIELGFDAKGIRCELTDMNENNIVLPFIASVTIDNYKHFIVVYEINYKKKYLIIGDPIDKLKKISFESFNKMFSSVIITFYPIKSLPIEKESNIFRFILSIVAPNKQLFLNICILSVFITIFSIITSFYTQYMLNSVSLYSKANLIFAFITFFSINILKNISNYFRNKLLIFINQKIDLVLTLDVFKRIIKLPYNYYQNRQTGDIISRINDLESIRQTISKVSLSIFVDLPLTFVSLIVLFTINKTLFIIGIIILILYFLIIIIFRRIFNDYIKRIQVKRGETTSFMVESISGFETIKGIHLENSINNKFEKKYVRLLNDIFKYDNLYIVQTLFKDLIDNIGFIVITFIGCILVLNNKLTFGLLLTFSSLLVYFLEPIKSILNLDVLIKETKNSIRRILDIINYDLKNQGLVEKINIGDIEFKNLNYSFNNIDYVLKNVNLTIKGGSKVMVVGSSGSGKSTLFKLLMRYYNINNNNIFINGIDINNYKDSALNNNIVYLSQNEILFNDTLYNNLIFDDSDSSKLLDISKMCFIDKILSPSLGYNMLIEENGFNLSGGERQRIFLARTLLKKFNILIIDEGLQQVDVDMERKILKNTFNYFKDKTIIFISHRLDNLDLFDSLIRIEKGTVYNDKWNG